MNNEKWKRAVEKLVPLVSEIQNILDDDLDKINVSVGQDGYIHASTMIDDTIYSASRADDDSPIRVDEPF